MIRLRDDSLELKQVLYYYRVDKASYTKVRFKALQKATKFLIA